jgi:hypothetical protein
MYRVLDATSAARHDPALNLAVDVGNEVERPVVVFFAPVPFYPHANLRHYRFLAEGIPDLAEELARRRVGFVLRAFPEHSLVKRSDADGRRPRDRAVQASRARAIRRANDPAKNSAAAVGISIAVAQSQSTGSVNVEGRALPAARHGLHAPVEVGSLRTAAPALARRKQTRVRTAAHVPATGARGLSDRAQSPGMRRHPPALAVSLFRAPWPAYCCDCRAEGGRAHEGEAGILRTVDRPARVFRELCAVQSSVRLDGVS